MKKENIDWDKVMNNTFIKPQLKWMPFLLSAREQNKKVIMLKRKDRFSNSDKKTAENFCIDYMDVEDFVNTNFGGLSYKKMHDYIK